MQQWSPNRQEKNSTMTCSSPTVQGNLINWLGARHGVGLSLVDHEIGKVLQVLSGSCGANKVGTRQII